MTARRVDLLGDLGGVVMLLVVGVPALTPQLRDGLDASWWACYGVAATSLVLILLPSVRPEQARWLLAPYSLAAVGMFLVAPDYPFAPIPMVVAAMTATWLLSTRLALGLIGALVAVLAVVWLPRGSTVLNTVVLVLYATWMLFAALLVDGRLRMARANQRLARANAELAEAQLRLVESSRNEERLRIARDLHDLVGHQLTALAVNLEVAAHVATGQAGEQVEQCRLLAKDLLRDVREVVSSTREGAPDLRAAVEDLARAVPSPAVHVEIPDGFTVPDDLAQTLLRCVQEAITNAIRHAAARNVWVRISQSSGEAVLSVRDDGRGGDRVAPGNGLAGMRERLAAHGGGLVYDGAAGFRLEARLPVPVTP